MEFSALKIFPIKKSKSNSILLLIGLVLMSLRCNGQTTKSNCETMDSLQWTKITDGCLHLFTYKSDSISDHPNLVLVIHGDAPFNKPGYQYKMARLIAKQNKNTIAVGLLRPGYTDDSGHTSAGKRGLTTGDNYTPEVINAVIQGIENLKRLYHPQKMVLIGHSGGAAITGNIIGLKPKLINEAILVSCPCDVPTWRKYMSKKQPSVLSWKDTVESISPLSVIDKIDDQTNILIVCGKEDETTPIRFSIAYYKKVKEFGFNTKLILIPNEGHEILFNEILFKNIKTILH